MKKTWLTIGLGTALLAACGGGGGGNFVPVPSASNVSGTDVLVSATQDANAAFEFVSSVAAAKSDSADPLNVGDASLATSDTDEPKPL